MTLRFFRLFRCLATTAVNICDQVRSGRGENRSKPHILYCFEKYIHLFEIFNALSFSCGTIWSRQIYYIRSYHFIAIFLQATYLNATGFFDSLFSALVIGGWVGSRRRVKAPIRTRRVVLCLRFSIYINWYNPQGRPKPWLYQLTLYLCAQRYSLWLWDFIMMMELCFVRYKRFQLKPTINICWCVYKEWILTFKLWWPYEDFSHSVGLKFCAHLTSTTFLGYIWI